MATLKQSIQTHNKLASIDPRFIGASAIIIKGIRTAIKLGKKGGSSRSNNTKRFNAGGRSESKAESEALDTLKRMEELLENLDKNVTSINESIEKVGKAKKNKFEKFTSIPTDTNVGKAGAFFSALLIGTGLLEVVKALYERKNGQSESQGSTEGYSISFSQEDKQAKLDEALNNLSAGINNWLSSRNDLEAITQRRTDIKSMLSDSLASWQDTINEILATRSENENITARREGMYERFKENLGKLQKAINVEFATRGLNENIIARREGMKESLANSLEKFRQTLTENLATRGTNEQIMARREEMITTFKKTFEEMALFLKVVFQEPAKSVAMQFAYMGAISIAVLKRMESAINSVASALGALQLAGATLVSSAQDTIAEAESALQSIPSAEKSLGASANAEGSGPSTSAASAQGSVSMQQSADAYEISSQKAGEITAMSGNQAGSRQTIINMNSNMPVNASITNGMDMDTFLRQLGIGVDMAMRSAAEGVPL